MNFQRSKRASGMQGTFRWLSAQVEIGKAFFYHTVGISSGANSPGG
ncbi:hypothetical protein DSBG_1441 [Desulfosporosinus sp. BG]|nr:hypothetical protein DSBG_1441 [Desulfosporosinus sp. BG]